MADKKAIEYDLPYLEKIKGLIREIALSYDLNPAIVAAVISRESGGGRLLGKWGSPKDTGDKGHGRGLMQADDRYWKGLLNLDAKGGEEDAWRYPAFNIAFGCWLLSNNFEYFKSQNLEKSVAAPAAIAAYNCGRTNVNKALAAGKDIDAYTTGHDYSRDVIERARWLTNHGWFSSE